MPPASALSVRLTRVAAVGFAALFALSAYWQLNDPDWAAWFAFYCAATVASLAAPWTRRGWILSAALCGLAIVWAGVIASAGLEPITWDELTGDLTMKTLNVERHREIGGLGIVALVLAGLALGGRARGALLGAVLLVGCAAQEPVGQVTLHRLNRTEYDNTVRDLLLTDLRPSADFPADDFGAGFDNQADSLSIAPLHLEAWENAADAVLSATLDNAVEEDLWFFEAETADASNGGPFADGWNLYT